MTATYSPLGIYFPWPFPVPAGGGADGLTAPTGGVLVSTSLSPNTAVMQFTGESNADHYNIFRSTSPLYLGTQINVSPIANPSSPYVFQFTDDGISSISAPSAEQAYYYRAVACDTYGNTSLPSDALQVMISSGDWVHDDIQALIVQTLKADTTLMGLLQGDQKGIRWHHLTREVGEVYPFIVVKRSDWKEDKRFRDQRHGDLTYSFYIYNNVPSSKPIIDIENRIIYLLDGEAGKKALSGVGAIVLTCMFLTGGGELYDEALSLYFQERRMSLTVVFQET